MLTAVRELQVPLLAALLLGGCATKAWRVLRSRSIAPVMDPAGLFPLRLRRPMMLAMCAAEFGLGVALITTARRFGPVSPRLPSTIVRTGTALFFLVAMAALNETRQRRPEAGCGCFGEFSETPIGWRTITRAGVLSAAAAVTIGLPPLRMPSSPTTAELWLAAAGLRAVPHRLPVPRSQRNPGQARLFRAVRGAQAPRRPHADGAALQFSVAPVRRPGFRGRPGRRVAGRMLAFRGVSGAGARPASRYRLRRLPAGPAAAHPSGSPRRGHRRDPRPAGTGQSVVI